MSNQATENDKNKDLNIEALINKIAFDIVNEEILKENEINKLLGILANNGVYAMWVYALDKLDTVFKIDDNFLIKRPKLFELILLLKPILYKVYQACFIDGLLQKEENKKNELTQEIEKINGENLSDKEKEEKRNKLKKEIIDYLTKEFVKETSIYLQIVSKDLHKLLFLKQLLEKTLIYARYHAKALGD